MTRVLFLLLLILPGVHAAVDLARAGGAEAHAEIRRLRSVGSDAAAQGLIAALDNPDAQIGARALQALADLGPVAWPVAPQVRKAAADPQRPRVRAEACAVLGAFKDDTAIDTLIGAVADADPGLADKAREALASIAGRDLGRAAESWQRWQEEWEAIGSGRLAEAAARLRTADLADPVAEVHTVLMFRTHRSQQAAILAELLRHPDERVATLAANGLRNCEGAAAAAIRAEAAALGLMDPAYRPDSLIVRPEPEPAPVVAAAMSSALPPTAEPAAGSNAGWVVIGGLVLVLAIVGYAIWRCWHEAHRQLSVRTELFRRNRKRIEFTR